MKNFSNAYSFCLSRKGNKLKKGEKSIIVIKEKMVITSKVKLWVDGSFKKYIKLKKYFLTLY